MDKTVVFFSSRTCSADNNYENYLLYLNGNQMSEERDLSIALVSDSVKTDIVYKAVQEKAEEIQVKWNNKENVSFVKAFSETGEPIDKDKQVEVNDNERDTIEDIVAKVYLSSHPEKGRNITKQDAINAINKHLSLLISIGFAAPRTDSVKFRSVYKYNWDKSSERSESYIVLAVKEISETDSNDKAIFDDKSPLWCDLLIETARRIKDVKKIVLILHDKDVKGHSNQSISYYSGVKLCKNEKLINNEYSDLDLSVVFFKHGNSQMAHLIGPFDPKKKSSAPTEPSSARPSDVEEFDKRLQTIIDYLHGIDSLKELAEDKLKKELKRN